MRKPTRLYFYCFHVFPLIFIILGIFLAERHAQQIFISAIYAIGLVSFASQTPTKGYSGALAFIGEGFLFGPQNSLFWNLPRCLHIGSPLVA
jgi:hypothetical protein